MEPQIRAKTLLGSNPVIAKMLDEQETGGLTNEEMDGNGADVPLSKKLVRSLIVRANTVGPKTLISCQYWLTA